MLGKTLSPKVVHRTDGAEASSTPAFAEGAGTASGPATWHSRGVTAFALVLVGMLAPLAVVLVGWVLARCRRHQPVGEWWGVAAGLTAMFLLASALAIAGWALPDALDRLPAEERKAVGPALAASPGCGLMPFARVVHVEVVREPNRALVLRYSCGLTHLGIPRFSSEARCADGEWKGPGPSSAGRC